MLLMEACVSPDGKTVSYYDGTTSCASMGLDKYHWQPEPLPHIWMWMQNPAVEIVAMMAICTVLVLIMAWRDKSKPAERGAEKPA